MNILQIISGRGVNGALVYCKILSEQLVARGHRVTVVCKPKSWIASNVDRRHVEVVESSMARFPFHEFRRIKSLIQSQRIELIHSHMTRAQNFAVALKYLTGTPVVATAHNRHFELHWNFNDFVIANSRSTYDYHSTINRVPSRRMATIYCCSDYERFEAVTPDSIAVVRKKLRLNNDDFLISVIGEIAIRKGHKYFLQALPEIIEQVPNLKVAFVGRFGRKQPHVRQLRRFILDNDLAGRVRWVGRQKNVSDYAAASEITVVPSIEEPLGLVAIEALMAGTPVVASETGGLTEIVRPNQTGLLFPPTDSLALAKAVIRLAKDAGWRKALGERGRQQMIDRFAPEKLIDQVEDVYRRFLPQKRAA